MADEKQNTEGAPPAEQNPVAAAVKQRAKTTKSEPKKSDKDVDHVGQAPSISGISAFSVGGPRVLVGSFVAGGANKDDYVTVDRDGYADFQAPNSKTPVTKLVWQAGARVRKDYYDRYKDIVVSDPAKAKLDKPGK